MAAAISVREIILSSLGRMYVTCVYLAFQMVAERLNNISHSLLRLVSCGGFCCLSGSFLPIMTVPGACRVVDILCAYQYIWYWYANYYHSTARSMGCAQRLVSCFVQSLIVGGRVVRIPSTMVRIRYKT